MVDVARFEHPLLDQIRAYDLMQKELERKHFGRWVVISEGQLRGDYKTYREASEAATAMDLNKTECLFRHVGFGGTGHRPVGRQRRVRNEVSHYRLEPEDIERSGVMIPILVRESTGVAMVDTGARITGDRHRACPGARP